MNRKESDLRTRLDGLLDGMSRRHFLRNSALAAGAVATTSISFSPPLSAQSAGNVKTLVYVFLRGAMDGLSLVVPVGSGANAVEYRNRRSATRMSQDDTNSARRPLTLNGGQPFGLHPATTGLRDLFNRSQSPLAIINGVGHLDPATYNRSHFDAQEQVELGTPGYQALNFGWLSRHLASTTRFPSAVFNAVAAASMPPHSLRGWPETVSVTGGSGTSGFHPDPSGTYAATHLRGLHALYAGTGELDVAARGALDAVEIIGSGTLFSAYVPGGGAVYPNTGVANNLKLVATLIRAQIGLNVATVDVGGWDTHNNQGVFENGGYYNSVRDLSAALSAFYQDMEGAGFHQRVAVVVQTEFGRQITENSSSGTDHGLAYPMLVLGGKVKGGWYGQFPSIAPNNSPGDAVKPMVDFRQVLATAADKLVGNSDPEGLFHTTTSPFSYSPMGFWNP